MRNFFKPGSWNAICDRCGFKYKANELKKEWQGLMTCVRCFETKHPSLFQRVVDEKIGTPWVKPEPADTFISVPGPAAPPAPSVGGGPNITGLSYHPVDWLQMGSYITNDGAQVPNSNNTAADPNIVFGTNTYDYRQFIERSRVVNPEDGSVAARWQTYWPQFNSLGHSTDPQFNGNYNEVKNFPSILYGKKPGYFGSGIWPAFSFVVRAPDGVTEPVPNPSYTPSNIADFWKPPGGSAIQTFPSGATPSTTLPIQLPTRAAGSPTKTARIRGKWQENTPPTGRGHLSLDIFLTQTAPQVQGFTSSSITHEIMIPLRYWGGYGKYLTRSPSWYDHDVTIDGVLYHVYCAKDIARNDATGVFDFAGPGVGGTYPGLRYTFSGLNPNFTNEETGVGRIGWKFIVFEPDGGVGNPDLAAHPLDGNGYFNIDFTKFLDHLHNSLDSRGVPFIRNTEYISSVEAGIEQVWGTADLTLYNYMVQCSNTVDAAPPLPAGNNS